MRKIDLLLALAAGAAFVLWIVVVGLPFISTTMGDVTKLLIN